jgi:hypothetical protein
MTHNAMREISRAARSNVVQQNPKKETEHKINNKIKIIVLSLESTMSWKNNARGDIQATRSRGISQLSAVV